MKRLLKENWQILIASTLVILLISLSTSSLMKKRIMSSSNLIAANWNVSLNQTGIDEYLSFLPDPSGTTASYIVNVASNSEVDVIYSIVVSNLPSGISIKLDNGSFIQENNGTITFNDVGTILYTDANRTKSHTLTFKASSSTPYVTERPVDVDVITEQILSS